MSYNTYPNPYQKHLTSEEVLQKRLDSIDRNWLKYAKVALLCHLLLLVFLFTAIVTVRFAFLIF